MELAGLRFLDSPGSGPLRFLEPKALRASSLTAYTLNPKHKPSKNIIRKKLGIIKGSQTNLLKTGRPARGLPITKFVWSLVS